MNANACTVGVNSGTATVTLCDTGWCPWQRQMMDVSRSSMQVDTHLCLFVADDDRSPALLEVGCNLFQTAQRHFILLRDIGVIQSHLLVVFRYLCICWFIR